MPANSVSRSRACIVPAMVEDRDQRRARLREEGRRLMTDAPKPSPEVLNQVRRILFPDGGRSVTYAPRAPRPKD